MGGKMLEESKELERRIGSRSPIHLLNKYLLSSHHMPGTV